MTYLVGYRHLPSRAKHAVTVSRTLTSAEWRRIGAICAVLAIVVFHATSYLPVFNTAAVWTQDHVDLKLGSFTVPVALWFQRGRSGVLDPLRARRARPLAAAGRGARRRRNRRCWRKSGLGAWLVASGNLILVAAILAFGNDGLSPIWPFLYFAMMGLSFLFYWPVTLALVLRAAPAPVNAAMMGVAFLTLFVASNIMGRLGGLYETLSPAMFWGLHAAVAAAGGVAVLVFGGAITRSIRTAA